MIFLILFNIKESAEDVDFLHIVFMLESEIQVDTSTDVLKELD